MVGDTGFSSEFLGLFQKRHELFGKQKMRNVVGLHLNIISILGGLVFERHNTSIVTEDVDGFVLFLNRRGGTRDGLQILKITIYRHNVGFCFLLLESFFSLLGTFRRAVQEDKVLGILASGCPGDNRASA